MGDVLTWVAWVNIPLTSLTLARIARHFSNSIRYILGEDVTNKLKCRYIMVKTNEIRRAI